MSCSKLLKAHTTLILGVAVMLALPTRVDDPSIFELEGNVADEAPAGDDWATLNGICDGAQPPTGSSPGSSVARACRPDPYGQTIFFQGGSKDVNDIPLWNHDSGSVPPKDEIRHAYAAAYNVNGALHIYFGANRLDGSTGDTNIGFWFFQQNVTRNPGTRSGFTGQHTVGDILVVSSIAAGKDPTTVVYRWDGVTAQGKGILTNITGDLNVGRCNPSVSSNDACAIVNRDDVLTGVAWIEDGTLGLNYFFEGGINVNSIFGTPPCFASFLAETRSSTSENAQLKDFVLGSFPVCGLEVTKACASASIIKDGTQILYNYSGTVKNTGFGTLYNVDVLDTYPGSTTPVVVKTIAALPGNAIDTWTASSTSTSTSVVNRAWAVAATSPGGSKTVTADMKMVTCEKEVNGAIQISKTCTTSLVEMGGAVRVRVDFGGNVTNAGNVRLTGIALADVPPAVSLTLGSTALNPGGQTAYSGYYYPTEIASGSGVEPGRYFFGDRIKVTAATPALGPALPNLGICDGAKACADASCPICPPGLCPPLASVTPTRVRD